MRLKRKTTKAKKTSSAAPSEHKTRSDDAIKDRIEHRLATDANLKKYDVDVKVNGGAVTLDGSVASEAQKAEAAPGKPTVSHASTIN